MQKLVLWTDKIGTFRLKIRVIVCFVSAKKHYFWTSLTPYPEHILWVLFALLARKRNKPKLRHTINHRELGVELQSMFKLDLWSHGPPQREKTEKWYQPHHEHKEKGELCSFVPNRNCIDMEFTIPQLGAVLLLVFMLFKLFKTLVQSRKARWVHAWWSSKIGQIGPSIARLALELLEKICCWEQIFSLS